MPNMNEEPAQASDARPSDEVDGEVKRFVEQHGVEALNVDDLTKDDLRRIAWSGSQSHLRSVEEALGRAAAGDVDYLAVRAPSGEPISIGGVSYTAHEGGGTLWQLVTKDSLRGLGLGTRLIAQAEARIKERGFDRALIGVEDDNPRARQLYERLGYRVTGHEDETWKLDDGHGNEVVHHADITLLSKDLSQR
jgi:ribosomal protein S18 acetylase RimI-like enzyme